MRIENGYYVVELNPQNGALTRLYDKVGALELLAHDRLAESFRLLLPLPDLEANYVLGTEQRLSSADQTGGGVVLRWDGPLTNARGGWDLDVETRIAFVGEAVELRTTVRNRTRHKLAEVWHAGLGGLMGVGDRAATRTTLAKTRGPDTDWLFKQFPESMGVGAGGGLRFAEYYVRYPVEIGMPWLDMSNQALGRGVYYGCHDTTPRLATLRVEMHPGLARNRLSGNWPSADEIAATAEKYPPGLVMHWVHMPYTPPGETFAGPPVVVQSHAGDWHAAARIYRAWFLAHFPVPPSGRNWLRREQAVQDTMFLLPEGNVMLTFKDMGRWAREASDYGVTTVMISGWNVGGHDNQYPNYTPDPRLGTWDDLAAGIAECHRLGVRVLFFANIQTVDVSTDWYKQELHRYRMMDAKGHTNASGWGMGTLGARMGLTRPPIAGCNPAFPAFRRILTEHMRKLAETGADGIHFDKSFGHPGVDFNPELPVPGDQSWFSGALRCLEETLTLGRATRPDFGLSVESTWDRFLSYCDAWWLWHDMLDHVPVMKYAFPEFMAMFPVVQPWDYNNANNAIRYGYQLLLGPVRYSASMADEQMRPIATYVAELLRIRRELEDTIFLGEFLDVLEVTVAPHPHLKFNTHRNPRTGQRACVLVNQAETPVETTLSFEGVSGPLLVYEPFAEVRRATSPAALSVPGERLAIVVEA
ncbi:MAG TPA: DUF6259 domain-containing protein [Chloroflexota bacterium]|nr:DUF6259 domain-containing protein [Chloroflexota bacterium]